MLSPLRLDIDPLPASLTPIDLDLVKNQAEVVAADRDALIINHLRSAVVDAEGRMNRTIYARAHRWTLARFPSGDGRIRLPRGKTQSVTNIVYIAVGVAKTLTGPSSGSPAGTDFQEDLSDESGGVLMPPAGQNWPSADTDQVAPVVITFDAGWLANEIPDDVIHAILFMAADSYDIRGSLDAKAAAGGIDVPEAMLSARRLVRWDR